ncbi:toxic anion resistance protein [Peribacillus frigoritolerans]|uniref:toxic anion resistance protein n=1 Tax=Peribacillus frigoritolerans TaxID=450367 RepID=UPI00105A9B46|nr:toxic anion resistance protein [Peribacillus frigoritolerans]TDL77924.1 toxic anion resistance protein [Peribacillus frigoritolerans]
MNEIDFFQQINTARLIDVLSEEEKIRAHELAKQINPKNHALLVAFGLPAQSKLLAFSTVMLEQVQRKDIGQVGEILDEFMKNLNEVRPDDLQQEETSFLARLFGKRKKSIQEVLSRFHKTGAQIDRISVRLERSKNMLLSDIVMLDRLYDNNKDYFHSLNVYIAAGEMKLEELHNKTIPELKRENADSSDPMKQQELEDLLQFADQLDQRLYDLKISREITIQSAPQIRMIQKTNQKLAEKIQSSLVTAIPLWKNQVSIALTLIRQKSAADAGRKISEPTNELYQKQAAVISGAKRSMFDLDTLKEIQENLQASIQETMRIHVDGKNKREETEAEIMARESELKQKLQA